MTSVEATAASWGLNACGRTHQHKSCCKSTVDQGAVYDEVYLVSSQRPPTPTRFVGDLSHTEAWLGCMVSISHRQPSQPSPAPARQSCSREQHQVGHLKPVHDRQHPGGDPGHRFACRERVGLGQQGIDGVLGGKLATHVSIPAVGSLPPGTASQVSRRLPGRLRWPCLRGFWRAYRTTAFGAGRGGGYGWL